MIYAKAEKRIAQYITFLDRVKYSSINNVTNKDYFSCNWEFSITNTIFRTPPENDLIVWEPIKEFPFFYGNNDETWWFRTFFHYPEGFENQEIFLEVNTQTDTLIFIDNIPVAAVNPFHGKIRMTPYYKSGTEVKIDLEVWAGHIFPGYHPFDGPRVLTTITHRQDSYPLIFQEPRLLVKEKDVYELYYDVAVLFEVAKKQEKESLLRNQIIHKLHRALLHIDFTADRNTLTSQAVKVRELIRPLLNNNNGSLAPEIYSSGNSHLDHAWLWTISETSRKCARTCANMAAYSEEFPEFRYFHSQPAQMVDLKKNYPAVFNRVEKAFHRGQWEPNGGMWVEADCNLTGGESLIRQFMLGHKTTKELFNYKGDVLWLPDVFGYSASLPQIMKGCGIEYFVTSKISWNDTTRFPYDLFMWAGIDGTQIPTHFITTPYEGRNTPGEIVESWNKVQHKDVQTSLMRSIGEGDGGGGTMRSDLEYMRRMSDLQGMPRNRWSGLSDAMKNVFSSSSDLPVYTGELYLELHRGTYTSQALIKKYNRKLEYALRELELKEVWLFVSHSTEKKKFAEQLNTVIKDAWKQLLTLQFHDILPGTSIRQVNIETIEVYKNLTRILDLESSKVDQIMYNSGSEAGVIVINTLPFTVTSMVHLPEKMPFSATFPLVQEIRTFSNKSVRAVLVTLKGMTAGSLEKSIIQEHIVNKISFITKENKFQTPWYSFQFDKSGGISELVLTSTGRNVTVDGYPLNTFLMVDDLPVDWDAWEIEDDYRYKEYRDGRLISWEIISKGDICLQIRQKLLIGKASAISQDIFFYTNTPRIDFHTEVDWQEEHQLLRVNFPTSVVTSKGYFDIPFGYIERDTHRNRPEDRAKFEVSAHKWAYIKDARLSAALLSDCKYGFRVEEGLLSLTLLRSATAPDSLADRGKHSFTYSFLPSDNIDIRNVIREGWSLNIPFSVIEGILSDQISETLFNFSSEDIMVEAIKVSEDRKGVILRLCESLGAPISLSVTPSLPIGIKGVFETNMLEEISKELQIENGSIDISLHSFEVKTLKFFFN